MIHFAVLALTLPISATSGASYPDATTTSHNTALVAQEAAPLSSYYASIDGEIVKVDEAPPTDAEVSWHYVVPDKDGNLKPPAFGIYKTAEAAVAGLAAGQLLERVCNAAYHQNNHVFESGIAPIALVKRPKAIKKSIGTSDGIDFSKTWGFSDKQNGWGFKIANFGSDGAARLGRWFSNNGSDIKTLSKNLRILYGLSKTENDPFQGLGAGFKDYAKRLQDLSKVITKLDTALQKGPEGIDVLLGEMNSAIRDVASYPPVPTSVLQSAGSPSVKLEIKDSSTFVDYLGYRFSEISGSSYDVGPKSLKFTASLPGESKYRREFYEWDNVSIVPFGELYSVVVYNGDLESSFHRSTFTGTKAEAERFLAVVNRVTSGSAPGSSPTPTASQLLPPDTLLTVNTPKSPSVITKLESLDANPNVVLNQRDRMALEYLTRLTNTKVNQPGYQARARLMDDSALRGDTAAFVAQAIALARETPGGFVPGKSMNVDLQSKILRNPTVKAALSKNGVDLKKVYRYHTSQIQIATSWVKLASMPWSQMASTRVPNGDKPVTQYKIFAPGCGDNMDLDFFFDNENPGHDRFRWNTSGPDWTMEQAADYCKGIVEIISAIGPYKTYHDERKDAGWVRDSAGTAVGFWRVGSGPNPTIQIYRYRPRWKE